MNKKSENKVLEKEINDSVFAIQMMLGKLDDVEVNITNGEIEIFWENLRIKPDHKDMFKTLHTLHVLKSLNAYFE